jgi:hypothetical protein
MIKKRKETNKEKVLFNSNNILIKERKGSFNILNKERKKATFLIKERKGSFQ